MINVLFVCHANICRSPLAEALFRHKLRQAGLMQHISVDSAGVSDVRIGQTPHPTILELIKKSDISNYTHNARPIHFNDYFTFNYMLATDTSVLKRLNSAQPMDSISQISLMLSYNQNAPLQEIEDPCSTGRFDIAYSLIDSATSALLSHIQQNLD